MTAPTMPADAAEIVRLATLVEQATGPDRDVDLAVHHVVQQRRYRWSEFGGMPNLKDQRQIAVEQEPEWLAAVHARGKRVSDGFWEPDIIQIPAYTASLDAAMTLIGVNQFWRLGNDGEGPDVSAFKATVTSGDGPTLAFHDAVAANPTLALTAAALKARARAQHDHEVG